MDWTAAGTAWVWGWIGSALLMVVLWLVQMRTRNAGIVDVGWAASVGGLAVYLALAGDGWGPRRALVGVLGGAWGLRLTWHLLTDRILGRPEEGRYVTLRRKWSAHVDGAFFVFFQAQALLAAVLALPFLLAGFAPASSFTLFDGLGLALFVVGLAGETLADRQLSVWKADPEHRGLTCRWGLWRYSRHPNYFFEWVLWCGLAALALSAPLGWVGLLSPGLILFFVLKVTGIPPTEAQAVRSRRDYREYQRTTSAFFPWFPKETS